MKNAKKLLALLIVAAMMLSIVHPITAYAVTNSSDFAGGSGTEEDPYLISNKYQLDNVRNHINAHFKLTCDIVFNNSDFAEGGDFYNDGAGFLPIGEKPSWDNDCSFKGVFDGNNFSIKYLYININTTKYTYAGLFGYNSGTIKNLSLIEGSISANVTGHTMAAIVGGIAGHNVGTIKKCYNSNSVFATSPFDSCSGGIVGYNDGLIQMCYNSGDVNVEESHNYSAFAGGIAGQSSDNSIEKCYNIGNISGTATNTYSELHIGGIVGRNWYNNISDCYNTGIISATSSVSKYNTYIGGISGSNVGKGITSTCYNVGELFCESTSRKYIGSISGDNYSDADDSKESKITNCYYLKNSFPASYGGTIIATECTEEQFKLKSTFGGFDFENTWAFDSTISSYKFPVLKDVPFIKKIIYGDIDGDDDVAAIDALMMKKYLVGIFNENDILINSADITKDGTINAKDLLMLKQKLAE